MSRSPRRGVTLLEVLVAVAIIAILIGMLLPATRRVRVAAGRVACQNNLKQVMLGLHNFESNRSAFPPGCVGPGAAPEQRLSWMVAVLPYVEQDALAQRFDREKGYAGNLSVARASIKTFLCPESQEAATTAGLTTYIASAGLGTDAPERPAGAPGNGFVGHDRRTTLKMIEDGTENTLALMETNTDLGPWARGGPATLRAFEAADFSHHGERRTFRDTPSGQNVAMADGSVRFLPASTDSGRIAAAVTIAGGERVSLD